MIDSCQKEQDELIAAIKAWVQTANATKTLPSGSSVTDLSQAIKLEDEAKKIFEEKQKALIDCLAKHR